jgi:GH15 family glucan-1,4-alpha-glucosidase
MTARASKDDFAPIGDYALIGDCHSAALVSSTGAIDWCTFPRFDSGSCFARILDDRAGGSCTITPSGRSTTARRYLKDTMVLETTLRAASGEVVVRDCFAMREGGRRAPYRQLLRVIECGRGHMDLDLRIEPRFDYGEVEPWIGHLGPDRYAAIGGNDALIFEGDTGVEPVTRHDLGARLSLRAGERVRLSMRYVSPELVEEVEPVDVTELDRRLEEAVAWWRAWSTRCQAVGPHAGEVLRSAIVLKALTFAPTGAIVAAPTTSLPEVPGGSRNWDYRYCWIRDSSLTVRSLAQVGHVAEANGLRRFVERSAAGSADDLRILYGVGGERRLKEMTLDHLEGYRGAVPVRVGNDAATQWQLDVFGHVVDLAWSWHRRGHSPDDDYWRFLLDLVDAACDHWQEPDSGIWEIRGRQRHFVHSKVMAWMAMDRGIRLAKECLRRAPTRRWAAARAACRRAIEQDGYDDRRGVFVRAFGDRKMDASLLLIPTTGFVSWDDERMVRTVDRIRLELEQDGLLRRYRQNDGLPGEESPFLACSFWLVECLARQGRADEARDVFDRAASTANDLGLFSEEYDTDTGEMLGNFPQGLTHLSHIAAALALGGSEALEPPSVTG